MVNNICYIIRSLKAAGAEKYVLDLASRIAKRGVKIHILSLGPIDTTFINKYDLSNVTIDHFPIYKLFSLSTLRIIRKLCRFIRTNNITCLHLNMRISDIIGGIAAILTKRIFISTQHDTQPWRYNTNLKNLIYKYLHRYVMKYASAIIVPSRSVKHHFVETERIPLHKLKVIYHGIELEQFACNFKRMTKNVKIGSLGRFNPEKGQIYIVEALKLILPYLKSKKVELIFAGDGPTRPQIAMIVKEFGINKYVSFLGRIYDVPRFLTEIDILIHAGISREAFCYAALEGLAAGKAVIATSIGGIPEFIRDHDNGILVPPKSGKAIAQALTELIKNSELHMKLSKNAAISCRPFFSIERMVIETCGVYDNITQNA